MCDVVLSAKKEERSLRGRPCRLFGVQDMLRGKSVMCVSVRKRTIVFVETCVSCCVVSQEEKEERNLGGGRVDCLVCETCLCVFDSCVAVANSSEWTLIGRRIDCLVCETCLVFLI